MVGHLSSTTTTSDWKKETRYIWNIQVTWIWNPLSFNLLARLVFRKKQIQRREDLILSSNIDTTVLQGWCGILIFDKYTYLASFWYLSLYKYPKYTYEGPKYTYYQNILMRRVNMRKCPKGGPLKKYFLTFQIWIVMHDSWNVNGG